MLRGQKGFTLTEIIIVIIILGILTSIAIPNYMNMVQQGHGQTARNNLITIYYAQKNYYFSHGSYCRVLVPSSLQCIDLASINTNLSLTISDNNFRYSCVSWAVSYSCAATNNADSNFVLTLTGPPNPIVLPGAATCANSTGANPDCNPSCASDISAYCPH